MKLGVKVVAVILAAVICLYFVLQPPQGEFPEMELGGRSTSTEQLGNAATGRTGPDANIGQRSLIEAEPVNEEVSTKEVALSETHVLRVILEGVTEPEALLATIHVKGIDERDKRPIPIEQTWPSQGLVSEFEITSSFAAVTQHRDNLRDDLLEVEVDHPYFLRDEPRTPITRSQNATDGRVIYEARVELVPAEYWPEFELSVLDARTHEHLKDIEMHISLDGTAFWGRNNTRIFFGDGLRSPIGMLGGREADQPEERVAALALAPESGELPWVIELARRFPPERGVSIVARAPGYAWGRTTVNVSKGAREILLEPAASMHIGLSNAQLQAYDDLNVVPMICVYWIREDGGNQYVHFARIDQDIIDNGLQLDGLKPGGYRAVVELGGGVWGEHPELARDEVEIVAGEERELRLELADPPEAPKRATLAGTISMPDFDGVEDVRLQIYFQPTQRWRNPDFEFKLSELQRVDGAESERAFEVHDTPVGMYRIQLLPFLEVAMVELPPEGRDDVEIVVPELAEVFVETVDGKTGLRVPVEEFAFRNQDRIPGQEQNDWAWAEMLEPGRFHFWATPETVRIWPRGQRDLGYGGSGMSVDLGPGPQSVRYELPPIYAMRIEFREGGTPLPTGPMGMYSSRDVRPIDHDGRVTGDGLQTDMHLQFSDPGLYEINFDRVTGDVYEAIPPRIVEVSAGKAVDVIVELVRR